MGLSVIARSVSDEAIWCCKHVHFWIASLRSLLTGILEVKRIIPLFIVHDSPWVFSLVGQAAIQTTAETWGPFFADEAVVAAAARVPFSLYECRFHVSSFHRFRFLGRALSTLQGKRSF